MLSHTHAHTCTIYIKIKINGKTNTPHESEIDKRIPMCYRTPPNTHTWYSHFSLVGSFFKFPFLFCMAKKLSYLSSKCIQGKCMRVFHFLFFSFVLCVCAWSCRKTKPMQWNSYRFSNSEEYQKFVNRWKNGIGHEELSERARTHTYTHSGARKQYDLTQPSNFHLNETHFVVMCCLLSIYIVL